MRPLKIVSGGQTGVDRAAWDVAIQLGYDWGGWVPKGRRAEDGPIPALYDRCVEHASANLLPRTYANIDDAGATLILARHRPLTGGTLRTYEYASKAGDRGAGLMVKTGRAAIDVTQAREWIGTLLHYGPLVLNIAGPRESKCPGIYETAKAFLLEVLR